MASIRKRTPWRLILEDVSRTKIYPTRKQAAVATTRLWPGLADRERQPTGDLIRTLTGAGMRARSQCVQGNLKLSRSGPAVHRYRLTAISGYSRPSGSEHANLDLAMAAEQPRRPLPR
jgi:hypothetical protein